jgi:Fe-S-cluster-containing dehydrogenase component
VVEAKEEQPLPDTAVGMLYDSTKCVGCQACVSACAQANNLMREAEIGPQDSLVLLG